MYKNTTNTKATDSQEQCKVIKAANELLAGLGQELVTNKDDAEWALYCWYGKNS